MHFRSHHHVYVSLPFLEKYFISLYSGKSQRQTFEITFFLAIQIQRSYQGSFQNSVFACIFNDNLYLCTPINSFHSTQQNINLFCCWGAYRVKFLYFFGCHKLSLLWDQTLERKFIFLPPTVDDLFRQFRKINIKQHLFFDFLGKSVVCFFFLCIWLVWVKLFAHHKLASSFCQKLIFVEIPEAI